MGKIQLSAPAAGEVFFLKPIRITTAVTNTTQISVFSVQFLGATGVPSIMSGMLSILKGPAMLTVAANSPVSVLGSRHESEQVPPQPYSKVKV